MRTLRICRLAGAGLVALIVVACGGGGGMPMTTEPEPGPLPTLVGTWALTETWTTDDGEARTSVERLTFVGDRAIVSNRVYDAAGNVLWHWFVASGWEHVDDTTINRLWFEDFTEDDVDNPEHGSVMKSYHWGNAERSVLFLHQWARDGVAFDRYERVPADTLPSPVGTWRYVRDDGTMELTIGLDGSFALRDTAADGTVWIMTGTGVLNVATYTISLTGVEISNEDANGVVTFGPEQYGDDGTGQVAFAPFDGGYAVSAPWDERDNPYGYYWLFFEPAP